MGQGKDGLREMGACGGVRKDGIWDKERIGEEGGGMHAGNKEGVE